MWIKTVWEWILRQFGIKRTITSDAAQYINADFAAEYFDISKINFNNIFSNKLATLATAESDFVIEDDNQRARLLNETGLLVWSRIKKITAMALGTGGCLIVPYVQGGKLYFDIASQDRLCINQRSGDKITDATVLADTVTINNTVYCRFVNYAIENNRLIITNKVTTQYGSAARVEQWQDIKDMTVANVDRVPFGYIKSPIDNRRSSDDYGVPITYGCKSLIDEIYECLGQIKEEFELKQVRLRVDERDFNKDKNGKPILTSKLFMTGHGTEKQSMFDIFDPAIRESSYYTRLTSLFELLEKSVGTSKGILTAPETRGATATEIKAGIYDTFALVCDIREAVEKGMNDFLYACDILANCYSLSPIGGYSPVYDWSYSMIESSAESWQQMKDAQAMGIRSKAELRAWQTGETIDEAQAAVDDIAAREPSMQTLLGMSE